MKKEQNQLFHQYPDSTSYCIDNFEKEYFNRKKNLTGHWPFTRAQYHIYVCIEGSLILVMSLYDMN